MARNGRGIPSRTVISKRPLNDADYMLGVLNATGTVTKLIPKFFAGSVTPAGAFVILTKKPLTASVTPSGVLTPGALFMRALSGSITATGALVALGGRALKNFVWDFGAPVAKWVWGVLTETWRSDPPQE